MTPIFKKVFWIKIKTQISDSYRNIPKTIANSRFHFNKLIEVIDLETGIPNDLLGILFRDTPVGKELRQKRSPKVTENIISWGRRSGSWSDLYFSSSEYVDDSSLHNGGLSRAQSSLYQGVAIGIGEIFFCSSHLIQVRLREKKAHFKRDKLRGRLDEANVCSSFWGLWLSPVFL